MKTNIVMKSQSDRELLGIIIRQETKTGFLNLSDLQEAYTHARVKNGWNDKRIDHVLMTNENHERIFYLLKKQGYSITPEITVFIEDVKKEGIAHVLKRIGAYKTKGARHTKTTWCDPYLWVLIAMELNPMLYAETVIWLTDKLIINRIEAGNFYKDLSRALAKFKNPDYIGIAKALNYCVFQRHEAGIRNSASQQQLKELENIERQMAFAIDMGYIKTQEQLIEDLRKYYKMKWNRSLI
jgi:hypothetical protein